MANGPTEPIRKNCGGCSKHLRGNIRCVVGGTLTHLALWNLVRRRDDLVRRFQPAPCPQGMDAAGSPYSNDTSYTRGYHLGGSLLSDAALTGPQRKRALSDR